MSLPTSNNPSQLSIRSFFQSKPPQYAPPPDAAAAPPAAPAASGAVDTAANATNNHPPPPPAAIADDGRIPMTAEMLEQIPPPPPPPTYAGNDRPEPTDIPPLPPSLPREASIRRIEPRDTSPLRRINALLLPVSYAHDFYRRACDPYAHSRIICWTEPGETEYKVVGGLVCRYEHSGAGVNPTLYIQSISLLAPYRSMGLITAAMDNIVKCALADEPTKTVETVSAHVWTENKDGIQWYERRGFKRVGQPVPGYYHKLRPDTAYYMKRDVRLSLLPAQQRAGTSAPVSRPIGPSPTASAVNLPPMNDGPPKGVNGRPPPRRSASGQSYQNQRAETEWNDLPADMAPGLLVPPKTGSEPTSNASSRSSSAARKKRDRSYPAAAFGNQP